MYCSGKQFDVLVMALWSLIKYEYKLLIHNIFWYGKTAQMGENTGKLQAGKRYTNKLSKILGKFPPGEEEYPGKLLPVNRNTIWFKRILWEFRAGKGNIRENFRLYKGNIFPSRKRRVSDIPAGGRENRKTFFYGAWSIVTLSSTVYWRGYLSRYRAVTRVRSIVACCARCG